MSRWIGLAVALAALTQVATARGEAVTRKASESDDDFMGRVLGPSTELAQKVVRSAEIAGGKVTLIGFVNHEDNSDDSSQGGNVLVGHLLIESSPNQYEHIVFPSCDEEGGPPKLEAVFFARTIKGAGRDLAVLCSWDHGGQVVNGTCYDTEFYRVKQAGAKISVETAKDFKGKFVTCDSFEANARGKMVRQSRSKFTTVAEVKKALIKLGLKQDASKSPERAAHQ